LALLCDFILIACFLSELLRRSVGWRAMRAFAVGLPPPVCQRLPHVMQGAEPAGVEALVAQPAVKLSTCPFGIGLPGSIWSRPIFQSSAQPIMRREVNSGPLSERTCSGRRALQSPLPAPASRALNPG
jgi:hypothetical protein